VQHVARVEAFASLRAEAAAWRGPLPLPASFAAAFAPGRKVDDGTTLKSLLTRERAWELAPETFFVVRALAELPGVVWRAAGPLVAAAHGEDGRPTAFGVGLLRALYVLWGNVPPAGDQPAGDVFARAAWVFAWACASAASPLGRATLREVVTAYDEGAPWDSKRADGAGRRTSWWCHRETRRAFMAGLAWAWWPLAPRYQDLAPDDAGRGVFTWDSLPAAELEHAALGRASAHEAAALLDGTAAARTDALGGASLPSVYAADVPEHEAWAALAAVLPPRAELQAVVFGRVIDLPIG
jgi:hypothetical protein